MKRLENLCLTNTLGLIQLSSHCGFYEHEYYLVKCRIWVKKSMGWIEQHWVLKI